MGLLCIIAPSLKCRVMVMGALQAFPLKDLERFLTVKSSLFISIIRHVPQSTMGVCVHVCMYVWMFVWMDGLMDR